MATETREVEVVGPYEFRPMHHAYVKVKQIIDEDGRDVTQHLLPHYLQAEARAMLLEEALNLLVGWHNVEPLEEYVDKSKNLTEYPERMNATGKAFDWVDKIIHEALDHHTFEEDIWRDIGIEEFRGNVELLHEKGLALADATLRLRQLTGEKPKEGEEWLCPKCGSVVVDKTTSTEDGTEYDAGCPHCGESFDEDRWIPADPAKLRQRLQDIYEWEDLRARLDLVVENAALRRRLKMPPRGEDGS